jgi:hypothetical protein
MRCHVDGNVAGHSRSQLKVKSRQDKERKGDKKENRRECRRLGGVGETSKDNTEPGCEGEREGTKVRGKGRRGRDGTWDKTERRVLMQQER